MTDCRGDVVVDHPPVPMGGRRSEVLDAFGHPDLAHEAGDRRCRAGTRTDLDGSVGEVRCDCFGVLAGIAGQMPASPFPAVGWVDPVVGDDVEAVLFGDDVSHYHSVPAVRFGRRLRGQPEDQHAQFDRPDARWNSGIIERPNPTLPRPASPDLWREPERFGSGVSLGRDARSSVSALAER